MCGLVGVAGNGIVTRDIENFKTLLYISISRGKDSTGVATVTTNSGNQKERIEIEKEAVPAYRFIEIENNKKWSGVFDRYTADLLMGHVRWATVGNINRANAHPFSKKNIIGMHNGTILNKEFRGSHKTDSELMFEKMDEEGVYDTLEELSPRSAFAVVVFEKGTDKVYFSRNDLRTLYVGIHKKRNVIYWASEERFLKYLNEDLEIRYFAPYKVYEMNISDIKAGYTTPWEVYDLTDKRNMKDPLEPQSVIYGYGIGYCDWYDAYEEENKDVNHTNQNTQNVKSINLDDVESNTTSDDGWDRVLDTLDYPVSQNDNPPFDVECVACDELIHPDDIGDSKVLYEGGEILLCKKCRGVFDDLDDDPSNQIDSDNVTCH